MAHDSLPTEMLCYHENNKRAALTIWWGAWLPLELNPLYREAVDALRTSGRTVCQMGAFQGNGGIIAVRHLFSIALNHSIERGCTDIVSVCSPRNSRGYATFGFVDMLPDDAPRVWDLARDIDGDLLPTRLIRMDILAIPESRLAEWRKVQSA